MSRKLALFALIGAALAASNTSAQDIDRDNVVIVLDGSGSMSKKMRGSKSNKLEVAKTALFEVTRDVPKTTNVGLLVFSAANMKSDWAYPLGPIDRKRLEAAIRLPRPGRKTPLGEYMKKGADALLAQRAKQKGYGSYRLLIVTDGEANDRQLVERYLPDILSRGITVDVIGVDMKSTHTLATRVHSYRTANDATALRTALTEVFAEVSVATLSDTGEDAFAVIAPLPDGMANPMIGALRSSGNQPIGERARLTRRSRVQRDRTAPVPPPRGVRINPPDAGGSSRIVFFIAFGMLVFAVVVLKAFVKAARRAHSQGRRRRRRRGR